MVHAKDVETQKLERNSRILKDVMRDFASTKMIWQKNLRGQARSEEAIGGMNKT